MANPCGPPLLQLYAHTRWPHSCTPLWGNHPCCSCKAHLPSSVLPHRPSSAAPPAAKHQQIETARERERERESSSSTSNAGPPPPRCWAPPAPTSRGLLRSPARHHHHWSNHQWPRKPPADAANTPANRRPMLGPGPCRGLKPKPRLVSPPLVRPPVAHHALQPPADAANKPATRWTSWAPIPAGGRDLCPTPSVHRPSPPLVEPPVACRAWPIAGGRCQHASALAGHAGPRPLPGASEPTGGPLSTAVGCTSG